MRTTPPSIQRTLLVLCIGFSASALAHIVPPEDYHPLAESYRRIAFMVNLNPVPWDTVQQDAQRITEELTTVAPEEASSYGETVETIFEMIQAERAVSLETP